MMTPSTAWAQLHVALTRMAALDLEMSKDLPLGQEDTLHCALSSEFDVQADRAIVAHSFLTTHASAVEDITGILSFVYGEPEVLS